MSFDRITADPNICHGKPCIRGHRIMVHQILDLLADGASTGNILQDHFPQISREDIDACVAYAACLVRNEEVHFVR